MADVKVLEEKALKGEKLEPAEVKEILASEGPVDGYEHDDLTDKEEVVEPVQEEKKVEKPVEKSVDKPKDDDDVFVRLERELAKEEGKENLTKFSEREKAYFYQMRKDRRARQKAEEERDAALFREIQQKQKPKEEPKEEEKDPLDGRDADDFLTVAEARALLKKQEKEKPKEEPKAEVTPEVAAQQRQQAAYLRMCEREAKETHADYDEVMVLLPEIINPNIEYQKQLAAEYQMGGNPALKAYELIKADPEFAKLVAVAKTKVEARKETKEPEQKKEEVPAAKSAEELEKEVEARKAQEALERNALKPKTTGHVGASEGKPIDEYTAEDMANMTDREFSRLPKAKREKLLRMFG